MDIKKLESSYRFNSTFMLIFSLFVIATLFLSVFFLMYSIVKGNFSHLWFGIGIDALIMILFFGCSRKFYKINFTLFKHYAEECLQNPDFIQEVESVVSVDVLSNDVYLVFPDTKFYNVFKRSIPNATVKITHIVNNQPKILEVVAFVTYGDEQKVTKLNLPLFKEKNPHLYTWYAVPSECYEITLKKPE